MRANLCQRQIVFRIIKWVTLSRGSLPLIITRKRSTGKFRENVCCITSFVAHWNPATHESLISFKYWTPLVQSTRMLGPIVSGPKHQIFLASVTSYSYLSARYRARSLKSSRALTSP